MRNAVLEEIVRSVYNNFVAEWDVKDFPKLYDIYAIIATESSWDPNAESPYARGLMQISKAALETINAMYQKDYSYDDLFKPVVNVWVGIRYLRWLYRSFEQYESKEILAVMAYNWGIRKVSNWLTLEKLSNTVIDETVPTETKNYVASFVFWRNWYKKQIGKK